MRRWVALGGIFLILFALALPAQAGLGDLLGGLLEDPISELTEPLAPLVTSVPLVEDLIETTDALTAPIVTVIDSVASPVVTVVDQVVDSVVEEVVSPVTTVVEEVVSPVTTVVEEVVDPEVVEPPIDPVNEVVESALEDPAPLPPVEPVIPLRVSNPTDTLTRFEVVELSFDQAPVEADDERLGRAIETGSTPRALLTSISDFTLSLQDREGNDPAISNTDWLSALRGWLASGVSSLFDVLAIPARFLEVLLRALTSAGSGLVAPAAILVALAVGGRRRWLPAS